MAKIVKSVKDAVTDKKTLGSIKVGMIAGGLQGFGVFLLGKTFGTIASAIGVGALPNKWADETAKKAAIVNQVSDATSNLLVGE